MQRFISYANTFDVESLGHLCRMLYSHDFFLDLIALHVRFTDLIAHALVIMERYDCETVGMVDLTLASSFNATIKQAIRKQPSPTLDT